MLKFFRLYQKYILAVGAVVLMVAFLVPQAAQMVTPGRGSEIIGRIDGDKVRRAELEHAAAELDLLGRINPLLTVMYEQDPAAWLLAVREARRLGLSAGPAHVSQMLTNLRLDEAKQHELAAAFRTDTGFIRAALRHWIMVETYRSLALGEARTDPLQRLQFANLLLQTPDVDRQMLIDDLGKLGASRLSQPLLRRAIVDQQSIVSGKLLVIPADKAVTDLPDPTDAELAALFEAHKEQFPGEEPGYRIEPRVKLDYLSIPYAEVLKTIEVDEVDAIAFHERNPQRFIDDDGKPLDYAAARQRVIEALRQERAQEKIDRMIRRARAVLIEAPEFRKLRESDGYKVLPEGYAPLSLRIVADTIEQEFGVRPIVRLHRDQWLTVSDLYALEGIGNSSLADRGDVHFLDYVMSARQMEPQPDNPLVSLRLQANVVGLPLRSLDGSRHLFRVIAAEPAHAPASLDEVRDQVIADARKQAAYEQLAAQADDWRARAAEQDLDELAESLELEVIDLPAVTRAGASERTVPNLPGVGQSAAFIDVVYEVADALHASGGAIEEQPVADRLVAAPLETRRALALFRVDDFKPLSQSDVDRLARSPDWHRRIGYTLIDEPLPNPLDYKALAKRAGFTSAFREE